MDASPLQPSACGNLRLQRWLLRLAAIVHFTALPAALLPGLAAEKYAWLMGQGQPALAPLMLYMEGGGAYVYVATGVLLWLISNDPVRHRPLVVASGWIYLLGGPAFVWIDSQAGVPRWWMALDSLFSLAAGAALLWACGPGGPAGGSARE